MTENNHQRPFLIASFSAFFTPAQAFSVSAMPNWNLRGGKLKGRTTARSGSATTSAATPAGRRRYQSQQRTGKIAYATLRSADHCYLGCGAILQAVEDQLDARRNAKLVKNAKKIIPHDFLVAGGWTARRVAVSSYFLTAFLGVAGWFGMLSGMRRSLILGTGIFGALLVSARWLGAARLGAMKHSRYRAEL